MRGARPALVASLPGPVLVLVLVLVLAMLAGCGSDDPGSGEIEAYTYGVSGGIAGIDRTLTVSANGVTIAESGGEPVAVTVEPRLLAAARDALEAAPLAEIADTDPGEPGPVLADDITYVIEAGATRLEASQGRGVDERLQPVIDAIDPVLVAAVDQVNPSRG